MADLPSDLAAGLARESGRLDSEHLLTVTGRLIERYRADRPARPGQPIMASDAEATAYAAYRMPATYTAIAAVLDQLPDAEPVSHLDLAGGTGAAVWAVADRWPSIERHTVLEQAPAAIKLGRALTIAANHESIRAADWQQVVLSGSAELPATDVITIGYLLSEIEESLQQQVILAAAAAAQKLLIIVEPGTKKGYRRILAARDQLLAGGLSLVAPCPHQLACPLQDQDRDWCHFSARVNRSATHRRAKGAELGYEDEKFSYLVAAPSSDADAPSRVDNRVLRHPQYPKGRVQLELCRRDGSAGTATVAKRDKESYRLARKLQWGDGWPATDPPTHRGQG
ncbi:MAG TPA: small ribosomal subunit Rsm22 family protein [Microlunatus sp.]